MQTVDRLQHGRQRGGAPWAEGRTERPCACGGAVSKVARARPPCESPSVGGQEEAAAVDSDCCAVGLL